MRENAYADSRIDTPPEAGILPFRAFISSGTCSCRIVSDMSGVHDSTAAENVWRRQTLATVGSPTCARQITFCTEIANDVRAKMCSWMRVSWMLASVELVTMRQLMMPSEIVSAIAWRR